MLSDKPYPNFSLITYYRDLSIDFKEVDGDDHVEIIANCPRCVENGEPRADTRQRLWANERKGEFCCYNCGWGGTLPYLVQHISRTTLAGALSVMKGKTDSLSVLNFRLAHQEYERDDDDEQSDLREVAFPHGFESFEECKDHDTSFHRYLAKRGIALSYAKKMGWGLSRVGYTRNRIIVPTFMDDRLVFWQARDILERKHPDWGTKDYKKVLNPKGRSKSHVLYNFDQARQHQTIVIVEGFIDAAKAGKNAVAINGKKLHAAQVEHLARTKCREVTLVLDPDAFTDQRIWREGPKKGRLKKPSSVDLAKGLLSIAGFKVKTVRLPDGRDAGSYEPKELRRLL